MKNLYSELSSKELKSKCGIYMITCNDHKYIGSSKSLYSRLMEHRHDLSSKNHTNSFLQKCYDKYGESNFYFSILEFCNLQDRIVRESFYIKELKSDMNLQDPQTRELSEESKIKVSNSLKKAYREGRKLPREFSLIEKYDFFGNFIEEYLNCKEAALANEVSPHTIQIAASKYYAGRLCGLYRFRYKNSKVLPRKFEFIKPQVITSRFKFFIIEPNGTEISIRSGIRHINQAITDQLLKGHTQFIIKGKPKVPFKQEELLEHPTLERQKEDNQQPSLESNFFEGSTTNNCIQTDNAEDNNVDTSILPLHTGILDSNPYAFK